MARNGRTPDLGPFPAALLQGGKIEPPNRINDMAEPEPRDTLEPRGGDLREDAHAGAQADPPADAFPVPGRRA